MLFRLGVHSENEFVCVVDLLLLSKVKVSWSLLSCLDKLTGVTIY